MKFPATTPEVRDLLGTCTWKLQALMNGGRVRPAKFLGRLAWSPSDVLAAAKHLGRDTPEVRNVCAAGQPSTPAPHKSALGTQEREDA
jgi:hypothetical protein